MAEFPHMSSPGIEAALLTNGEPREHDANQDEPPSKRVKASENRDTYRKGVAPVRHEYASTIVSFRFRLR